MGLSITVSVSACLPLCLSVSFPYISVSVCLYQCLSVSFPYPLFGCNGKQSKRYCNVERGEGERDIESLRERENERIEWCFGRRFCTFKAILGRG